MDDALKVAARKAADATLAAMRKYSRGEVIDEDDVTGVLVGRLDGALTGQISGLRWTGTIVRHRKGVAAQERRTGADLLLHVKIRSPSLKYSKGVLVQAKRVEPGDLMSASGHDGLVDQCERMLEITPAAFVFDYAKGGMRCASATKVAGAASRNLHSICDVTPYRFFYEFFRCPIGDKKITSGIVDDLQIPIALTLSAVGANMPDEGQERKGDS